MIKILELERFESLGDNCEFGFFERVCGREVGSLLRWAITPPDALVNGLRSRFSGLYDFDYLTPHTDGMVRDTRSGFIFHSQLLSKNKEFIQNEQKRREIHRVEWEKINYLSNKLIESMSLKKIFVYKRKERIPESTAKDIADAIASLGPSTLLVVTDLGEMDFGQVKHVSDNLYIGRIDKFAPYHQADDLSVTIWTSIVQNAAVAISN